MSPARISPVSFLKLSADVASFYGFRTMREVERGLARNLKRSNPSFATATVACATKVLSFPQEPVLAFYATPSPTHLPSTISLRETGEFGLCAVGSDGSTGELLILKTISTIVSEWGSSVARIRLNALGDKESRERYAREIGVHVRRKAGDIDESCRQGLMRNPLSVARCTHDICKAVLAESPRSVNYLSEKSRAHFRKVLEQIESLGFPYEIDDQLLGDEREQHILFAIDLAQPDATVVAGVGGRYDEYVRRHLSRKEGTAVSASIYFRKKGAVRSNFLLNTPARPPKIFFVQLGSLAKLRGLGVLDMLRRARLPVLQSFDCSRLSPQLATAQQNGVSHLLIMGQREALDSTVIVRTLKNGTQETVIVQELPKFLKHLRF